MGTTGQAADRGQLYPSRGAGWAEASWRDRLLPPEGPWWHRFWVPLLLGLAAIATFAVVLLLFLGFYLVERVPAADELAVPGPTMVLDAADEEIRSLDPGVPTGEVDVDELPDHLPQAVLAAEDRDFYEHAGFSPRAIARAALANLFARDVAEGASTITQQYVDLAIAGSARTYVGKLREVSLAMKIEDQVDKDTILELYLNSVPLGRAAVGFEAGAHQYFDVPAAELDVNQAATLAGILAAPSAFDPERNPDAADTRRTYVLEGMAEEGWLDEGEADELIAGGLPEVSVGRDVDWGVEAYYFDALIRELETRFEDEERDFTAGLRVYTEMDRGMQQAAHETLDAYVGDQPFTGAIVSIDPGSGGVRALVGGTDYVEQQFNTAIQSLRQPGSAFKTFGLAAYFDAGYAPESRYPAPAEIEVEFDGHGAYEVSNFENADFGAQTVREATHTSTNTVYIQMAAEVGPEAVKDAAVRAGITDHEELDAVPSLIIGTREVTVLDLTDAYATLAGEGTGHTPRLIRRVEDVLTGDVLYEAEADPEERLDANLANQVTDVLRGVVEQGTGTGASIGRPAAGKTGTTDDNIDAWFAGYVPQLATTVWVGHLEHESLPGITGGDLPAPIWRDYMSRAVEGMEPADFTAPDWSGLEVLEVAPEPEPSPEPTPEPTPDPEPTPEPTPDEPDDDPPATPPGQVDDEDEEEEEDDDEEEENDGDGNGEDD